MCSPSSALALLFLVRAVPIWDAALQMDNRERPGGAKFLIDLGSSRDEV